MTRKYDTRSRKLGGCSRESADKIANLLHSESDSWGFRGAEHELPPIYFGDKNRQNNSVVGIIGEKIGLAKDSLGKPVRKTRKRKVTEEMFSRIKDLHGNTPAEVTDIIQQKLGISISTGIVYKVWKCREYSDYSGQYR